MGRPRKPTAVLQLTGSFKKDPQRRREDPPTGGALGNAPAHFDDEHRSVWDELSATCPLGVLTLADRWLVELCCVLMARFRNSPGTITSRELSQLVSCLSRMGMTPADRSKVGIANKEKTAVSEFEQLASELRPN